MTRLKPGRGAISPAFVDPQWLWAWRGLIRAYVLTEGVGDAFEAVTRRRVTPQGGGVWVKSPYGPALSMSGASSNLSDGPTPVTGSQNRTVLMVVRNDNNNSVLVSIDNGTNGSNGQRWSFRMNLGPLRIEIQGSGYNTSLTPTTGEWHVVVCRLDGTRLGDNTIFLDGQSEQAAGGNTINTNAAYDLDFGKGYGTSADFTGDVALALFWDRALSDAEILALTDDPFGPFRPAPIEKLVAASSPTISPAGSVTPSGALMLETAKTLAGSATPTGTVTRRTSKTLAGSTTTTGTLGRHTNKTLTGAVAPSGSVIRQTAKTFIGSTTPSGILSVGLVKLLTLVGSVTPTGTLQKTVTKTLGGSVAATGTVVKTITKSFAGSVIPSGLFSVVRAATSRFQEIALTAAVKAVGLAVSHKTVEQSAEHKEMTLE